MLAFAVELCVCVCVCVQLTNVQVNVLVTNKFASSDTLKRVRS